MTYSIKTTIRAFLAPDHRIAFPEKLWNATLNELHSRGGRRHEAGAFLLGVGKKGRLEVKDAIYYDELDPKAYDTGVCVLHGDSFAKLWAECRKKTLTVVADIHTHPGRASQSHDDRTNPMIARAGHVAIIVPNFADPPVRAENLGVYQYQGHHEWTNRSGLQSKSFLYIGFWS